MSRQLYDIGGLRALANRASAIDSKHAAHRREAKKLGNKLADALCKGDFELVKRTLFLLEPYPCPGSAKEAKATIRNLCGVER